MDTNQHDIIRMSPWSHQGLSPVFVRANRGPVDPPTFPFPFSFTEAVHFQPLPSPFTTHQNDIMTIKEEFWLQSLEQEETELLAHEFVEQVLQNTQNVLFERHIENQLIPFATHFAKATMMKTIKVSRVMAVWYYSGKGPLSKQGLRRSEWIPVVTSRR